MIDMFKAHTPETFDLVSQSVDNAFPDLGFLRLAYDNLGRCSRILASIML